MAKHHFGIMNNDPVQGKRFDEFEPEKYNCITVDDDYIEDILLRFRMVDSYSHTLDIPIQGLEYCGITLIPPSSHKQFISVIEDKDGLSELQLLVEKAIAENKYVIHYGL